MRTAIFAAVLLGLVASAGFAVASAAGTNVIRKQVKDHSFVVTVRPDTPQAGRRAGIDLDLATVPTVPDPTFGDRVPVRGASLVAIVAPEGNPTAARRYSMHPLIGAGIYGFHWTPTATGLHTLKFEQRGAELPELELRIGVGVETPEQGDAAPRGPMGMAGRLLGGPGQTGGGARRGPITPVGGSASAKKAMTAMAEPAGVLSEQLAGDKPLKSVVEPAVDTLLTQAKTLGGTVPDKYRVADSEYDALAKDLVAELEALKVRTTSGDMAAARREWDGIVGGTCAKCHVKFWWAITPDLGSWPQVTAQPWHR